MTSKSNTALDRLGLGCPPGERRYGQLRVTTRAAGDPLAIPVHVVRGHEPGPVLLVGAASHGDEIATILVVRQLLERVVTATLRGTLLVVPLMNPPAFETQTSFTRLDDWSLDEAFPVATGGMLTWARGWATQQLASALAELVEQADAIVDLHGGSHNLRARAIRVNSGRDTAYAARALELARAFGLETLSLSAAPEPSLAGYAALVGVPLATVELGGVPLDEPAVETGVQGILRLMRHLGQIDGTDSTLPAQRLYRERHLIRAQRGGMFFPVVGFDALGSVVPGGSVLGRIVNPLTLRESQVVTAPYEGTRLLLVRGAFSTVHPGEPLYDAADEARAEPLPADAGREALEAMFTTGSGTREE